VNGISFVYFDESDVVRHQLVQRIVRAYDEFKARSEQQLDLLNTEDNGKTAEDSAGMPS
jgi:phosphate starvation-inducible PhoH-like protein